MCNEGRKLYLEERERIKRKGGIRMHCRRDDVCHKGRYWRKKGTEKKINIREMKVLGSVG